MSLTIFSEQISCRHIKYLLPAVCLLLLSPRLRASESTFPDTINVRTVTVTAFNHSRELPLTSFEIDSAVAARRINEDLGNVLQFSSPVILKRMGSDGLASLSLRGMSGSHTSVLWNGMEINAPMTGQMDFALIPMFAADKIKISPGGADLSGISGSIGGKIYISSNDYIPEGISLKVFTGAGSYDKYTGGVSFDAGRGHFGSSTKLWFRNALNDFRFVNEDAPGGPETLRRTNAASHMKGLLQDFTFSNRRNKVSAHLWLNDVYRLLPSAVTTVQNNLGENQKDRSVRAAINYTLSGSKIKSEINAGYGNDINIYNYDIADIHGNNRSESYNLNSSLRFAPSKSMRVCFSIGDELQKASALSYSETHFRNMLSASVNTDINLTERVLLQAQVRNILVSASAFNPEFTIGASYKTDREGVNIVKGNFSHNIKYPSLNDLYWNPGGNSSLKPEVSTGGELSFSHSGSKENRVYTIMSVTLFDAQVTDLIQWSQGSNSYWEAGNLKSVNAGGAEMSATTIYNPGQARLKLITSYAYTRSVMTASGISGDASAGKQLMYIPAHIFNLGLNCEYGVFHAQSSLLYNSRRYIVSDNSQWLKGYLVNDLSAGVALGRNKTKFNIDITVDNLFNAVYESTKGYPMPLRTFMFDLVLTFNQKTQK